MKLFKRLGPLSILGGILIITTPVGGIISFAIGSVLFGETNLENSDGLTALGILAIGLPALIGLGSILVDLVAGPVDLAGLGRSQLRMVAIGFAAFAALLIALGVVAFATGADGDPNIGGGLLVLFGIVLVVPALVVISRLRTRSEH